MLNIVIQTQIIHQIWEYGARKSSPTWNLLTAQAQRVNLGVVTITLRGDRSNEGAPARPAPAIGWPNSGDDNGGGGGGGWGRCEVAADAAASSGGGLMGATTVRLGFRVAGLGSTGEVRGCSRGAAASGGVALVVGGE
jgi:hypothetical protein